MLCLHKTGQEMEDSHIKISRKEGYSQTCVSFFCSSFYVFWTSCNFSLCDALQNVTGIRTTGKHHSYGFYFFSQEKAILPDSPLEERSETDRESERCLFFFEWLSSSSDSEPFKTNVFYLSFLPIKSSAPRMNSMRQSIITSLTERERDLFLWCFFDFLECFLFFEWWCWHSCCSMKRIKIILLK